jgi:hypothetical protein
MPLKEFRTVAWEIDQPEERDETTEDAPTIESRSGYRVYASRRPVRSRTEAAAERTVTESIKAERAVVDLLTWQEGWDGYDAPKPNPESVAAAYEWVGGLYRDVRDVLWIEPHVSADEDGEVAFEWWKGRKKLTVYVTPKEVEYIKVEKVNSSLEMKDGSIETPEDRCRLWNWLLS